MLIRRFTLLALLAALVLAGCGAAPAANAPIPAATALPAATAQPSNTPTATATPRPSPTPAPPTATPTAAPPTASAVHQAPLHAEPGDDAQAVGVLCEGDGVEATSLAHVGDAWWYRIRVTQVGADCDPSRAAVGAEGWTQALPPAVSGAFTVYAKTAEIVLPTSVRSTPRPTATDEPAPTEEPTLPPLPPQTSGVRTGAICRDGSRSSATGRGACSHHGGVSQWLYR